MKDLAGRLDERVQLTTDGLSAVPSVGGRRVRVGERGLRHAGEVVRREAEPDRGAAALQPRRVLGYAEDSDHGPTLLELLDPESSLQTK